MKTALISGVGATQKVLNVPTRGSFAPTRLWGLICLPSDGLETASVVDCAKTWHRPLVDGPLVAPELE